MIIKVKVKPDSLKEEVEKISDCEYLVKLEERAEKGKANARLINILAKEFNVNARLIKIKNPKSRNKLVEIKQV